MLLIAGELQPDQMEGCQSLAYVYVYGTYLGDEDEFHDLRGETAME
jgi:hypothetical protein